MPTEEQISKLPKWAQDHIRLQESNAEYYRDILKRIDEKDTNTRVQDYNDGDRHLPEGSCVIFTGDTGDIGVQVVKYTDRSVIQVASSGMGTGSRMYVRPVSSNVIEVGCYD